MLDIHPDDAVSLGLADGNFAQVESRHGATVLPVRVTTAQRRGEVFAPMHWTDQFSAAGPIGRVVGATTDPISGQPELKLTPVQLTPVSAHWHGLLLRAFDIPPAAACHWSRIPLSNGHAFELVGWKPLPRGCHTESWITKLLGARSGADVVIYADPRRGTFRYASLVASRLDGALFLARDAASLPSRDGIAALMGTVIELEPRASLLAAQFSAVATNGEAGRMVCSCFAVGFHALSRAIADHRLTTVAEIGSLLRAGTNCGSCLPELRAMLRDAGVRSAA